MTKKVDPPRKGDIVEEKWTKEELKAAGLVHSCGSKNVQATDFFKITNRDGGRKLLRRFVACEDCMTGTEYFRRGGKIQTRHGKAGNLMDLLVNNPSKFLEQIERQGTHRRTW